MKTIILNMVFDDENTPDIGSIKFDRYNEHLHLLGEDVDKLNTVLTRAVCIGTYHTETFYFKSGDVAIADDTQRAFVYNADSDSWTEWLI